MSKRLKRPASQPCAWLYSVASPCFRIRQGSLLVLLAAGGANSLTFGNATSGLSGVVVIEIGTLTFAQSTGVTVVDVVSGAGSVIKTGSGRLTLTGTIGTLSISVDANLGDVTGSLTLDGGVLRATGTTLTQLGRTIVLGTSGGGFDIADAGNNFTVMASLAGGGGLGARPCPQGKGRNEVLKDGEARATAPPAPIPASSARGCRRA
jgi:hypothetical protein